MSDFLQLSYAESMYHGPIREESWSDFASRKTAMAEPEAVKVPEQVMITLPSKVNDEPPVKRRAGRKKLDSSGQVLSGLKTLYKQETKRQQRAVRRADRLADKQQKDEAIAAHRQRAEEAAKLREEDIARANRSSTAELAPVQGLEETYRIQSTDAAGTRFVRIDHKTVLEVRAGKDVNEAVLRFRNRKQTIF